MLQILLKDLRFQATHGVFELEELWGTSFRVDLKIDLKNDPPFHDLKDTVDYARVFELVKSVFASRELLIENLANRIYKTITDEFYQIHAVEISIIKEDPPIAFFNGEVGIVFKKTVGA